jgi:replicative DNA helicase
MQMAKRSKRYNEFYQFMSPYLEKGNPTEIAWAKKEYRRRYKARWRRVFRKENKSYAVAWTKEELHTLTDAAKKHKQKPTRFIKQATMAYINKRYVVPNQREMNKLLQLVAMTYNTVESIAGDEENYITGVKRMQEELFILEQELRVTLLSPKTIEQVIEQEIQKDPEAGAYMFMLIERMHHGH